MGKGRPREECGDFFNGMPYIEAECRREKGHKGKHRERWRQNSNGYGNRRAKVKVEWEKVADDIE